MGAVRRVVRIRTEPWSTCRAAREDALTEDPKPIHTAESGQTWADLLSPGRRQFLVHSGLTATSLVTVGLAGEFLANEQIRGAAKAPPPPGARPTAPGMSPLPITPRRNTDIKSYHAHVYFDEDTHEKAALIHRWAAERFHIELGD